MCDCGHISPLFSDSNWCVVALMPRGGWRRWWKSCFASSDNSRALKEKLGGFASWNKKKQTRNHIYLCKLRTYSRYMCTLTYTFSFLSSTWLPLRSPLILAKHSICLVSDLWLLESLSPAFKAPCTPELILGAKHCRPNPHSPKSTFTICFHSNCLESTSRLMLPLCVSFVCE